MRITLTLFMLACLLFLLTMISGGSTLFTVPLVWLLILGFPVFVIESLLTLWQAARFFVAISKD